MLIFQVVFVVGLFFCWTVFVARMPFDADYTSGELLDHQLRWSETGQLYSPLVPAGLECKVLSYPPLLAVLLSLFSSPLLGGRVVSLAGSVAIVTVLVLWVRQRGHSWKGGLGAVGVLGGSFIYNAGQMHVEVLASLGTISGFALLSHHPFYAGICLGLACFGKQTQLVLAATAVVWAYRYHKGGTAVVTGLAMVGVPGTALCLW
jgi:hypothetical protein